MLQEIYGRSQLIFLTNMEAYHWKYEEVVAAFAMLVEVASGVRATRDHIKPPTRSEFSNFTALHGQFGYLSYDGAEELARTMIAKYSLPE